MLNGIKSPDELQDRDILRSFDASRGAGAQIGEFILKKEKNETPFMFVNRVKGEYRAWYDGKAAEERSKARASEASRKTQLEQLTWTGQGIQQTVRPSQASLEESLAAQESALTQEYARCTAEWDAAQGRADELDLKLEQIKRDLAYVRKFRAELSKSYPPAPVEAVGGDLSKEVGYGGEEASSGVGEQDNPEVNDSGSTEAHEDDPQGTSVLES